MGASGQHRRPPPTFVSLDPAWRLARRCWETLTEPGRGGRAPYISGKSRNPELPPQAERGPFSPPSLPCPCLVCVPWRPLKVTPLASGRPGLCPSGCGRSPWPLVPELCWGRCGGAAAGSRGAGCRTAARASCPGGLAVGKPPVARTQSGGAGALPPGRGLPPRLSLPSAGLSVLASWHPWTGVQGGGALHSLMTTKSTFFMCSLAIWIFSGVTTKEGQSLGLQGSPMGF